MGNFFGLPNRAVGGRLLFRDMQKYRFPLRRHLGNIEACEVLASRPMGYRQLALTEDTFDSGQLSEGVDVRDTSRAEIANFNEAAERWFAAVWDLLDAPRSLRGLVDLHDGIPSLVEIRRRKAPLMWTIDRRVGRLRLQHSVQFAQNRTIEC